MRSPTYHLTRWKMRRIAAIVDKRQRPNINALADIAKSVRIIELNVKAFGYDLARQLADALPPRTDLTASIIGLPSKAATQADIESDWCAYWAGELKSAVVYHRKLWELCYVMQAIYDHGHLRAGARGLGFGCGTEPFPSYLAAHKVDVTMTDLAEDKAIALGWQSTNQHAQSRDQAFHPRLVDRDMFDRHVSFRIADMNAIPADLVDYDFCWSMCAVEHLGSIQQGLDFITASLDTLRPGGLSVHTMEFNCEDNGPTIDHWPTVLFQRKHIEALAAQLRAAGHDVAELDFTLGDQPMDRFIDLPPYYAGASHGDPDGVAALGHPIHLKLALDGFVATCFGIIIRKAA